MKKFLYKHPELQKYIWLEFSIIRLIVPVLIIGATIFATMNVSYNPIKISRDIILGMMIFFIIGWGGKLASDSVVDEFKNNTWILLKMTPITPSQFLVGKLFGATLYSWYGGLITFLLYLIFTLQLPFKINHLKIAFITILFAIAIESFIILGNIITFEQKGAHNKLFSLSYQALLSIPVIITITILHSFSHSIHLDKIRWFNLNVTIVDSFIFISIFLTLWIIIALYRNIKTTFQIEIKPFIWPFFIITTYIFLLGFTHNFDKLIRTDRNYLLIASLVGILFTLITIYTTLFFEAKNFVKLRKLYNFLKRKEFKKFYIESPIIIHTLPFLIISILIFLISPLNDYFLFFRSKTNFNFFIINLFLYLIRDIIAIFSINIFSQNNRWSDVGTLVYISLIHFLIPIVLFSIDLQQFAGYLSPLFEGFKSSYYKFTPLLIIEILLLFFILKYLWRKNISLN